MRTTTTTSRVASIIKLVAVALVAVGRADAETCETCMKIGQTGEDRAAFAVKHLDDVVLVAVEHLHAYKTDEGVKMLNATVEVQDTFVGDLAVGTSFEVHTEAFCGWSPPKPTKNADTTIPENATWLMNPVFAPQKPSSKLTDDNARVSKPVDASVPSCGITCDVGGDDKLCEETVLALLDWQSREGKTPFPTEDEFPFPKAHTSGDDVENDNDKESNKKKRSNALPTAWVAGVAAAVVAALLLATLVCAALRKNRAKTIIASTDVEKMPKADSDVATKHVGIAPPAEQLKSEV